jgi:hypothetical protein
VKFHGRVAAWHRAAHDAGRRSSGDPARPVGGSTSVEMIIGIALIVIAALETWFIVRTVQANMGRPSET